MYAVVVACKHYLDNSLFTDAEAHVRLFVCLSFIACTNGLQGDVCTPIGPVKYPGLRSGLFVACATGKPAYSKYKVLARHRNTTLVEV